MRNQATTLFNKRLHALRKEKNYYNKFIFNGHFMVFLLILLGAFIFGYGEWLKHIPTNINFSLIAAVIVALTSIFPMRPLLKEADKIFYYHLKNTCLNLCAMRFYIVTLRAY